MVLSFNGLNRIENAEYFSLGMICLLTKSNFISIPLSYRNFLYPIVRRLMTMKVDSPEFYALFTPELKLLSNLFKQNDFEIRMAGGAVRDILMGISPSDIDFATDATPTQMKGIFEKKQIRMLHKKGEEHGTITCRINDTQNFEITTLRIDVLCDGRRAEVKYVTDWQLDAFRRDLTVNSLFLDLDGTVFDYTGGIADIRSRRIAFVGDPNQRIQEDYLRILRYFRFFGRLALLDAVHEKQNLEAIIRHRDGLKNVSGERLWAEIRKIIVGRLASPVLDCMLRRCSLGPYLSLPNSDHGHFSQILSEFDRVISANSSSNDSSPDIEPSTALAALFATDMDVSFFQKRCKCSNADRELVEFILMYRDVAKKNYTNLNFFKHLLLDSVFNRGSDQIDMCRKQCVELLKYVHASNDLRHSIENWTLDAFPISGIDLMEAGVEKGPKMRATLNYIFNIWKTSDCSAAKDKLLLHITDSEINDEKWMLSPKRKRKHIVEMRKGKHSD